MMARHTSVSIVDCPGSNVLYAVMAEMKFACVSCTALLSPVVPEEKSNVHVSFAWVCGYAGIFSAPASSATSFRFFSSEKRVIGASTVLLLLAVSSPAAAQLNIISNSLQIDLSGIAKSKKA